MAEVSGVDRPMRVELLGRLRVWRDDQELDLGPGKQRAVLAVLLLNANRPVSTTAIVDAVWGDDPPDNGANVVQKYVAGLRRVLEPDRSPRAPGQLLALTDAGYVLHVHPGSLDIEVFQREVRQAQAVRSGGDLTGAGAQLRAALAMWREEALAGLHGPVFESARERLREERAAALETCAEIELELGRHASLVPELVRLVADFPLRERLRYLLMLALYRSGRQAEALAAYRDARLFLTQEFGVEPGEPLQQLQMRILRSDPTLGPPHALPPPTAQHPALAAQVPPPTAQHPAPTAQHPALTAQVPPPTAQYPAPSALPLQTDWMPPPPNVSARQHYSGLVRLVAVAVPVLSFGLASWMVIAYFAIRRRSRLLGLAAVGYLVLVAFFFGVAGAMDPEKSTPVDIPMMIALLLCTFGGALHVLLLTAAPTTGSIPASIDPAVIEFVERRTRREQARALLSQHPEIARELRIGRPDLPRTFDDGGLVDINSAPEHVLANLPGIDPYHAKLIATVRDGQGLFASTEDLIVRGLLPAQVVRALHETLIAVPRA